MSHLVWYARTWQLAIRICTRWATPQVRNEHSPTLLFQVISPLCSARWIHVPYIREVDPWSLCSARRIPISHIPRGGSICTPWGRTLISHDLWGGSLHDFAQPSGFLLPSRSWRGGASPLEVLTSSSRWSFSRLTNFRVLPSSLSLLAWESHSRRLTVVNPSS